MRPDITRMNVLTNLTIIKLICALNQYKNSIEKIKSILRLNQLIGGKLNEQPRIGDCILVNFINLSWSQTYSN